MIPMCAGTPNQTKDKTTTTPGLAPGTPTAPSTPATIAATITPEVIAAYKTDKDLAMVPQDVFRKAVATVSR